MVKRLLVIDRDDQGNFSLSVEAGTMRLGANSHGSEAILRDLHISRIHCEIEVEEDRVVICKPESKSGAPAGGTLKLKELRPGETVQIGSARLHLEDATAAAKVEDTDFESPVLPDFDEKLPSKEIKQPLATLTRPLADETTMTVRLRKQLLVIDGADKGRYYSLPETGSITIGKTSKYSDIVLHDLYVSRTHCQLEIDGDHILVTHLHGDNGTLINGQRVTQQSLVVGDVLRVGNEHLRLETALAEADEEGGEEIAMTAEDEETMEVEVLEEEASTEAEGEEDLEKESSAESDPYALPHPPVDQLRKLENQNLGYYRIGSLLGRGHTGLVFRSQDSKNKQVVALKVMSPDFPSNDAELQRFVRALKVWAHLQNRHLVSLFGAGKTSGYCWLAREYIDGEGLLRTVQRQKEVGHQGCERAIRIAIHLGKALDFLHTNRVAHGNLTPRNILIQKNDHVTKLADLMLNQALEGSKLQKMILGKKLLAELPYLAPEQTDPHAPGTPLGDLYSLGAVLYFLLTGEPPFTGATPREVVAHIREGKLVRPRELQRGIPALFESAVLMLMNRRPEERFQTAADFLAAVGPLAVKHGIEV